MTRITYDQITCEKCLIDSDYKHIHTINIAMEPALKEAIMDDSIFIYRCPHCHHVTHYHHPLFYYDPDNKFIIEYSADYDKFLSIMTMFHQHNLFDDYQIRWTDNWYTFKEKIQLVDHHRDDRLVSIYKELLLEDFMVRYPEAGTALVLYEGQFEERIVVISEHLEPKFYAFPENWYDAKAYDNIITKTLRYDTTIDVNQHYAKDYMNLDIDITLVDVATEVDCRTYALSLYDHAELNDQVLVPAIHNTVREGVIKKIYQCDIRDVPYGVKFIRQVKQKYHDDVSFNDFFYRLYGTLNQAQMVELLKRLMDINVYVPLIYSQSHYVSVLAIDGIDHKHFIPLYTCAEDCDYSHDDVVYFRTTFDQIVNQDILFADGFVINPRDDHLLFIDQYFINIYNGYKRAQSYGLN